MRTSTWYTATSTAPTTSPPPASPTNCPPSRRAVWGRTAPPPLAHACGTAGCAGSALCCAVQRRRLDDIALQFLLDLHRLRWHGVPAPHCAMYDKMERMSQGAKILPSQRNDHVMIMYSWPEKPFMGQPTDAGWPKGLQGIKIQLAVRHAMQARMHAVQVFPH